MSLDRDTTLEPLGEGRWRGSIHKRWWVVAGPFGGYVSGFFVRALQELAPERHPRSLTVHFLAAPQEGEIEVEGTVEREGGAQTSASLRMTQAGETVALALAAAARWKDGEAEWQAAEMPEVPEPEDSFVVDPDRAGVPFQKNFDIHFAGGGSPVRPSERPLNIAWLRLKSGPQLDHLTVAAMADCWLPPAFSFLGRAAMVPTLDLTVHFRAPLPHEAQWCLVVSSSRRAVGGVWECDTDVWARDGTLLAQARQLAVIRG